VNRQSLLFLFALLAPPLLLELLRGTVGSGEAWLWDWPLREPVRALWLIGVIPLMEELAFRGTVQGLLNRYLPSHTGDRAISPANLVTSVLFVLFHLVHHPCSIALLTFIPSLIFGYFRERYRSLIPPILLHLFYNYIWFASGLDTIVPLMQPQ